MNNSLVWLMTVSLTVCSAVDAAEPTLKATPVPLPGGSAGIGFDDLGYSETLKRILVPAGRSGNLDLIDPQTAEVTPITGFSAGETYAKGHGEGITSVDSGRGLLFVTDRTSKTLSVVDPGSRTIVAHAALASGSDYVRWVEPTKEIWVTEPDEERIEIFTLPASGVPQPAHAAFIAIADGPEALVIDATRGRAYTHLWKGSTVVIDPGKRVLLETWKNGCVGSRGMALDAKRGFLFVGCAEGKAVVLGLDTHGAQLGSLTHGAGVDIISYNAELQHLYLPGGRSASMAIISVSDSGKLSLLGAVGTSIGSHCVASDDRKQAWVCDPDHGQLLLVRDTL